MHDNMQIQIYTSTIYGQVPSDHYIEFRPISRDNKVKSYFFEQSNLPKLIEKIERYAKQGVHCFLGVLPRKEKQGNDTSVNVVPCLWIDIDAKHYGGDKQQCLTAINDFKLKPTLVVDSGNGYHAYWSLKQPADISSPEKRVEVTNISKALHKTIGADSTFNLSRILRVPGTYNVKDPQNLKMAKIIQMNLTATYTLEDIKNNVDFAAIELEAMHELDLDQKVGFSSLKELEGRLPIHVLERAKKCPPELENDRSSNDFWVAIKLFEMGLNDAEALQAFKLFAESHWSAGEKVARQGTDYLVKHTLPQAKLRANSLDKLLQKLDDASNPSDKYMYTDKVLEHLITMTSLEQQIYLKKVHEMLGGTKELPLPILKNRLKYLRAKQGPGRFFEIGPAGSKSFVPHLLGNYLLNRDSYMFVNSTLFRYGGGVFKDDGVAYASQLVQSLLQDNWKSNYRDEVLEWLKDKTLTESQELEIYPDLINVKNGMLNVKTKELVEHDSKYKSTTQLDAYFDPKAELPRLDQFAEEVFVDDAIDTLWEFNGYILLGALEMKRFVIFTGGGNNGKSIWLNVINTILGEGNVVNEPLQKLANNNFSVANLFGKVANINADLESEAVKYTGIIKMLTGGDKVAAEIKYGASFYFKNRARLLFSCNELPTIHDYNDAFFERLMIVNCPNHFSEDQRDPDLINKLTTEEAKSAWLNRALEGIDRLLSNGKFTQSESIAFDTKQYRYSNDTIAEFIQTNLIESEGDYITKEETYEAYKMWCKSVGRYPCSLKIFTRRAKGEPNNLILFNPKIEGRQVPSWKNVTLTDMGKHRYLDGSKGSNFSISI